MMRRRPRGAVKDEITYFFLIKDTDKGTALSAAQRKNDTSRVTKAVQKEGGQCHLYSTRGAPFDYISVITGVSTAAAVRIAEAIESRGTVKATLVSGLEVFNAP